MRHAAFLLAVLTCLCAGTALAADSDWAALWQASATPFPKPLTLTVRNAPWEAVTGREWLMFSTTSHVVYCPPEMEAAFREAILLRVDGIYSFLAGRFPLACRRPVRVYLLPGFAFDSAGEWESSSICVDSEGGADSVLARIIYQEASLFQFESAGRYGQDPREPWPGCLYFSERARLALSPDDPVDLVGGSFPAGPLCSFSEIGNLGWLAWDEAFAAMLYLEKEFGADATMQFLVDVWRYAGVDAPEVSPEVRAERIFHHSLRELDAGWRTFYGWPADALARSRRSSPLEEGGVPGLPSRLGALFAPPDVARGLVLVTVDDSPGGRTVASALAGELGRWADALPGPVAVAVGGDAVPEAAAVLRIDTRRPGDAVRLTPLGAAVSGRAAVMADAARSLGLVVTVAGDAPQADGPAVLMLEAAARPEVCKLAALFALTEADVPAGDPAEALPPVPVQDAWARLGRRVEPLKPAGTVEAAVRRIAALAAVDYDQYWSRRNVGNACDAVLPDMMPVGGTAHEMLDAVTGEAGLGYGIRHGRLVFTHGAGTGTRPDLSVLQPGPQVPAVLGGGYWLITTTDPVYPTISWQTYRRCRTCFSERSSRGQRR